MSASRRESDKKQTKFCSENLKGMNLVEYLGIRGVEVVKLKSPPTTMGVRVWVDSTDPGWPSVFVNTLMNFLVLQKAQYFLVLWTTVSFSRKTLVHNVRLDRGCVHCYLFGCTGFNLGLSIEIARVEDCWGERCDRKGVKCGVFKL